ncbi:MAG: homoserine kinase [bacterium]|nr:homoserine kinase [bacterium]MDE0289276.1 homoserine kinase [bacterium]MDE0439665.1 homoserine kinase [bacterium]
MKEASAPASSANLGPGFDTLALALDLRCEVRAEVASTWSIRHVGPESYRGSADDDAILAAARRVSRRPLRMEVANQIPLCRGLGSSAAAYASGTLAAHRANGEDPGHGELFRCVMELEGHPDNAAAAIYGGLVAVVDGSVIHPTLSPDLVPIVAVPGFELRTSDSRKMIPGSVAVETAVRTIGRVAALLEGLRTGSGRMLDLAVGDELHEAPRTACNPHAGRLMAAARESGALHACLSGAGPSILCLARRSATGEVVLALEQAIGAGGRVMILEPDTSGAR